MDADPRARFAASLADGPLQRSTFRLESAWSLGVLGSGRNLLSRHGSQSDQLKVSDKQEKITVEYSKENRAYRYIPQELASDTFRNLLHLNLARNKLKEMAPRIFQFTLLRTLILAHNEILRIESSIEKLAHLEHLSLAGNYVDQLPAELYKLTALTHLDLSSNKLRAIRPGVRTLHKLTYLSLARNDIASLPEDFEACSAKLTYLDASHNQLTSISLASTGLQYLSLKSNKFAQLPSVLESCTFLTELDAANNLLPEFPRFTRLQKVQVMDLSHNSISEVPATVSSFTSLERLYLEHNYLTSVPPQMASLQKIRELMLCKNQITDVTALLKNLPLLGVSIRSLEDTWTIPLLAACLFLLKQTTREELEKLLRSEIEKKEMASIRLIQRIFRSYRLRLRFRNVVRRYVALEAQNKLLVQYQRDLTHKHAVQRIQAWFRSSRLRRKWFYLVEKLRPNVKKQRDLLASSGVKELSEEETIRKAGWCFDVADANSNVLFSATDIDSVTKQPLLRAATLPKLVEKITSASYNESNLVAKFLCTYHTITTAEVLLELLLVRYALPTTVDDLKDPVFVADTLHPHHQRVVKVLQTWLHVYFTDFIDSRKLRDRLTHWANTDLKRTHAGQAEDFIIELSGLDRKAQRSHLGDETFNMLANAPPPIRPLKVMDLRDLQLYDWDPEEAARQFCLIDFGLYQKIRPRELLDQAWNKRKVNAPNVTSMIERFNQTTNWIATQVVSPERPKNRTRMLTWFICVAQKCREINNFNCVMQIVVGLTNAAVSRLKSAWDDIPEKMRKGFDALQDMTTMLHNYKNYRAVLATASAPCLPFLALALSDLTFTDDGNKNKTEEGLLNFSKRRSTAQLIFDLLAHQKRSYAFESVTELQEMLLHNVAMGQKELYELSLLREPRKQAKDGVGSMLVRRLTLFGLGDDSKKEKEKEKEEPKKTVTVVPAPAPVATAATADPRKDTLPRKQSEPSSAPSKGLAATVGLANKPQTGSVLRSALKTDAASSPSPKKRNVVTLEEDGRPVVGAAHDDVPAPGNDMLTKSRPQWNELKNSGDIHGVSSSSPLASPAASQTIVIPLNPAPAGSLTPPAKEEARLQSPSALAGWALLKEKASAKLKADAEAKAVIAPVVSEGSPTVRTRSASTATSSPAPNKISPSSVIASPAREHKKKNRATALIASSSSPTKSSPEVERSHSAHKLKSSESSRKLRREESSRDKAERKKEDSDRGKGSSLTKSASAPTVQPRRHEAAHVPPHASSAVNMTSVEKEKKEKKDKKDKKLKDEHDKEHKHKEKKEKKDGKGEVRKENSGRVPKAESESRVDKNEKKEEKEGNGMGAGSKISRESSKEKREISAITSDIKSGSGIASTDATSPAKPGTLLSRMARSASHYLPGKKSEEWKATAAGETTMKEGSKEL